MSDDHTPDVAAESPADWNPTDPDIRRLLDRIATFEAAVADTLEALGNASSTSPTDSTADAPSPQRWADGADADAWDELLEWVNQLNANYSLISNNRIASCWPAHPGVVEEVAAAHRAWKAAAVADAAEGDAGTDQLAAWHDRWLWPMLRRLDKSHYTISACRAEHVAERETAEPTDRSYLPSEITKTLS